MTHKDELLKLQMIARSRGAVCTFFYNKEGYIDSVFYVDRSYDPLSFAEKARPLYHK